MRTKPVDVGLLEYVIKCNGGKMTASAAQWRRVLNMTRCDFEKRYGTGHKLQLTAADIARGL